MRESDAPLFYEHDLFEVLQANLEGGKADVDQIPESQFRDSSDADIVEHVYSKREVIPLELHEDQKEMDTQETQVDARHDLNRAIFDMSTPCMIPGMRITVIVPFSGDANLWRCRPSTYTLNPPRGCVRTSRDNGGGYLEIVLERPSDSLGDGGEIKREFEGRLSSFRNYLGNMKGNVDAHNRELRAHIQQCVTNRRARLGKHAEVAKILSIPLKKRSDAPDPAVLPIKRKLIRPLPSTSTTLPEPGIRNEDYEHILNVIRHEGRSFEATPGTFARHDEEELRDIILAHLNGHYEGDASGETFRRAGKTDIRIESDNRAAFVGECKVWRGQKHLIEATDQLLGYLTWRDCKAALIVFNRDVAGFSGLQVTLEKSLETYPNFISRVRIDQPGEWRVRIRSREDVDREITLHVFLFNLFVSEKGKENVSVQS
jgi:hypothetical protein